MQNCLFANVVCYRCSIFYGIVIPSMPVTARFTCCIQDFEQEECHDNNCHEKCEDDDGRCRYLNFIDLVSSASIRIEGSSLNSYDCQYNDNQYLSNISISKRQSVSGKLTTIKKGDTIPSPDYASSLQILGPRFQDEYLYVTGYFLLSQYTFCLDIRHCIMSTVHLLLDISNCLSLATV